VLPTLKCTYSRHLPDTWQKVPSKLLTVYHHTTMVLSSFILNCCVYFELFTRCLPMFIYHDNIHVPFPTLDDKPKITGSTEKVHNMSLSVDQK